MANNEYFSRIIHKHDIEANWIKAATNSNFIPKQGEIIVYDIDENYDYERIKIGDGITNVTNLPFNMDQVEDYLSDLGALTIDLEGSTEGTPATIDADTFQGYTIDSFVMYNVGDGNGEVIDQTIDADTLGGVAASEYATIEWVKAYVTEALGGADISEYATKAYVDELLGGIENGSY